jgi:diguanylate cyclase (GGDEF)-like protein
VLSRRLYPLRATVGFLLVLALGAAAGVTITLLENHADASRKAQANVVLVKARLLDLENAPFSVSPRSTASVQRVRRRIASDRAFVEQTVHRIIAAGSPPAGLRRVPASVAASIPVTTQVVQIFSGRRLASGLPQLQRDNAFLQANMAATESLLTPAERIYSHRAANANTQAVVGSLATIFFLLVSFALVHRRSRRAQMVAERLLVENEGLLAATMDEAITDPLTGLGNRRRLKRDLAEVLAGVHAGAELMVCMFDLDSFKAYNDTFGHGAGDALLARLALSLSTAAGDGASVYRLGGDEFCLLAQTNTVDGDRLLRAAVAALSDAGQGWMIQASWGVCWMPTEAASTSEALRLADERMYAQKTSRDTAGVQTTAALVQVLIERDVELGFHICRVAELAAATGRRLGLPDEDILRISLAAQLHDIGKTAIPESILAKDGPLNAEEWDFVRRHTMIGERIIAAAPSLAHTASLVRSSHERVDGTGYPDRLAGRAIPLGSRIIMVCDAYDAMTARRVYRMPMTLPEAIAELRLRAGTQFDAEIVEAFVGALVSERQPSQLLPLPAGSKHAPAAGMREHGTL